MINTVANDTTFSNVKRTCWLCWMMIAANLCFPVLGLAVTPEVQSLDGTWQIVFDRNNEGKQKQWLRDEAFPRDQARNIAVPSCWELMEKDYEGVAFYRHTFRVPQDWKGKVIRLHFDAVNFRTEVCLNDKQVGVHDGGFTPFEFRVDNLLKYDGENVLTLRVVGPILLQDKQVDGMGPMQTPQWRGGITGGIWQSVKLIATHDVYVNDTFIEPKISDNTATFHLDLMRASEEKPAPAQVDITVRPAGKLDRIVAHLSKTIELKPGANKQTWTLSIPDAVYWSPDNPYLYQADVSVTSGGKVSDHWTTRFGMREFTIRDKQFYLNGKPFYLKATFFEGLYPLKLAYPDSREMAIREIQLAKDAGFNMIRPWRKPPPPMWLDLADEMGVLTIGSMAIECMGHPTDSPNLHTWVENEVRQTILRDRNRACVVQWELFNELHQQVLKEMLHPMAMLARSLDPTRLILDESGGFAQGANMYLPYESEPIKFNDVHHYPGPLINEEVYQKLLLTSNTSPEQMKQMGLNFPYPGRNVVPGLMTYFSELGYGSLPNLVDNNKRFDASGNPITPAMIYHRRLADQTVQTLKESGFDAIYPDLERFCLDEQQIHGAANKRMIEAVRCNPKVVGYCIHALTAGDWVIGAGLLDIWRNPKTYAYEGTQAANQPRILPIRFLPRNVYAERGTKIEITSVNILDPVQGDLKLTITDSNDQVIFTKTIQADAPSGIASIYAEQLDTKSLKGTYTIHVALIAGDGSTVAQNSDTFDVFQADQLIAPKQRLAVLDPSNSIKPFLKDAGIDYVDFDTTTDRALPVFVSRTQAKLPAAKKLFNDLAEFIKAGGTAVYLQSDATRIRRGHPLETSPLLPIHARAKVSAGLWFCVPHIVKDHPIFEGLPTGRMMGQIYENIWAQTTLIGTGGEAVVGSINFDTFPNFDRSQRNYYGPGDMWWGSDLAIVPVGKGRAIVSQLRIVDNIGKDPVADKLLFNIIRFVTKR